MLLHELIDTRHAALVARWMARVRGPIVPETLVGPELVDHIPQLLREIGRTLRGEEGSSTQGAMPGVIGTSQVHGEQRLRLGFSLDSIVLEYGALRDAIWEEAKDAGIGVSFAEAQVVFDCIIAGIAHAVSAYTRHRDSERDRQTNEHFAFIAHELRNPLSNAGMAYQILKERKVLPADRAVATLERALQRTRDMVEHALVSARVASGIALCRQPTTLEALLRAAAEDGAVAAEAKCVAIHVDVPSDAPIEVDLRLIRSALDNLLRNAVKYTTADSTVDLRGRVEGGHVTIEIEDCCGGLAPGQVERAFAPFVRLEAAPSEGGFGLGLAIAKEAVSAHGGAIRVQNLPHKGCVFCLEIPVGAPT